MSLPSSCMACAYRHYIFVPPSRLATVCGHDVAIDMDWAGTIDAELTDLSRRPTWCPLDQSEAAPAAIPPVVVGRLDGRDR